LLDVFEAFEKQPRIAAVQTHIILGGSTRSEPDSVRDHEGHCFRLGFPNPLRGFGAASVLVEAAVCQFMDASREYPRGCLPGKQSDFSGHGGAFGRCDFLGVFESDILRGYVPGEPLEVGGRVAGDSSKLGQRFPVGLFL
jgi:hypothetical protein